MQVKEISVVEKENVKENERSVKLHRQQVRN